MARENPAWMKYAIEDKPPLPALMLYGLQWWVVSLTCAVNLGVVTARMCYANDMAGQVFFLQKLLVVTGLVSLAQIVAGHGLPLVTGPASILLVGMTSSAANGINAIFTAAMIGGAFAAAMGYGGMMSRLRTLFTPRIVAVTLILVALTLGPTIIKLGTGGGEISGGVVFRVCFMLALPFALLLLNNTLQGVARSLTLPAGLVGGSALFWLATGFPAFSPPTGGAGAAWFIMPEFDAGATLSFGFCFIALLINELGSVEAVGQLLGAGGMERRIRLGCGVTGLGNVLAGFAGVLGPVDYSLSAGVIPATGCAARRTLVPSALGLMACALFPAFAAWLTLIPGPVLGGIMIYLMALQIGSGLGILARDGGAGDFAAGIVVGLPLMIGLVVSFAPREAFAAFPEMLRSIVGNGFVMGILTVVLLEHAIMRKKDKG